MNINENFKNLENRKKSTCKWTGFCPNTSLVYIVRCYIPYVIQFDKLFHPVVEDVNYLICIIMNIYERLKNDRKIIGKKKISND